MLLRLLPTDFTAPMRSFTAIAGWVAGVPAPLLADRYGAPVT